MTRAAQAKDRAIRWGILSTARINRALLGPLARSERSELVAVASRNPARARAYADRFDIPKSFGSYEELLADSEIDAVYVSLPNSLHCEWTVAAAEAGKHVLCEKPLVLTVEEMDRVQAVVARRGVVVFEAFMYLHHPQTLRLREMIRTQQLGQLQVVVSHFGFLLSPASGNTRLRPELGGGSLWDVGVYPVSLAVAMAGAGSPIEACGQWWRGDSEVDMRFAGQLRFSNRVVAQVSCDFLGPLRQTATLMGSEGVLHVGEPWKPGYEGAVGELRLHDRGGNETLVSFPSPDPYECEIAAMESCVLDGASPIVPLSLSRQILQAVLALYRSAESGRSVSLPSS